MTISSTVRIAGPFIGSGAATVFPFAFKVFAAAEMQVAKLNTTSNVEIILVLNTDYTVTLNGDQNGTPGGTITLPAVLASGYNLTITSDIANLQPTDLTNQGGFYPEVITDALDRATIQIQQLDQNSRAIKIPLSDGVLDMTTPVVAERASKYLAFDAAGLPVVSAGTGSDSALRTDLANATAVSAGSRLSGFRQDGTGATARTVDAKLKDTVSVKDFGAVGDGTTDDTAAIQAALTASNNVSFPFGAYRITNTISIIGNKYVEASNAVLNKDFNGVGLAFTGGSSFNYITGTLSVVGVGSFAASTAAPSTNPSAHGITITNNRVIVDGSLISNNHQGNGLLFTSNGGNSNRCVMTDIRCTDNGVNGIRFSGTTDNASVWKVGFYCTSNREAGIYFDNDFIGRSWNGFVYCESNAVDGTSDQLYIGKLRNSNLFVYAEESVSSGFEITIGANCQFLELVDTRESGSVNNASLTCRLTNGNKTIAVGDTTHYGYVDCINLTNNSAKYADLIYETSEGTIGIDRVRGNRQLERYVIDPSTNVAAQQRQATSFRDFTVYGNIALDKIVGSNGTLSSPTAKSVAEIVLRQSYGIQTAAATAYEAVSMRLEATSIGGGNKASGNLIWATTANGTSAQTDAMQLTQDANLEILQNGKGIRLRQPNGTVRLITVDNSGALVVT